MFTDNHFKTLFCINVNSCIDYIYDSQVNLRFYEYCRKNILQNTKKVNQIFKIFLTHTIDETIFYLNTIKYLKFGNNFKKYALPDFITNKKLYANKVNNFEMNNNFFIQIDTFNKTNYDTQDTI